jgi:hypothetical protein
MNTENINTGINAEIKEKFDNVLQELMDIMIYKIISYNNYKSQYFYIIREDQHIKNYECKCNHEYNHGNEWIIRRGYSKCGFWDEECYTVSQKILCALRTEGA